MDFNSIGSSSPQAVSNRLLQKLPPPGADAGEADGFSGILGDLMTLSPGAPAANKAEASAPPPPAVGQAMNDLLSGQKDVQGDLAQLKGYFAQSPQSLNTLMGALQGGGSGVEGLAPTRNRTDDRQAQAIARYLQEAQQADARSQDDAALSGIGVVALFG